MTYAPEITYTPTCATCPLARHIDGDRYECTAPHNTHNAVTRGHWQATKDCEEAIEQYHKDNEWLTKPIGTDPDAIFGKPLQPAIDEPQSVQHVKLIYQDKNWKLTPDKNSYKKEVWEVLTGKSKLYRIRGVRNSYGGLSLFCSCEAAIHNRKCYHVKAVQEADKERIVNENRTMVNNRGAIAQPDGTVKIDEQFYRTMGDVRNNRGGHFRY